MEKITDTAIGFFYENVQPDMTITCMQRPQQVFAPRLLLIPAPTFGWTILDIKIGNITCIASPVGIPASAFMVEGSKLDRRSNIRTTEKEELDAIAKLSLLYFGDPKHDEALKDLAPFIRRSMRNNMRLLLEPCMPGQDLSLVFRNDEKEARNFYALFVGLKIQDE